MRESNYDLTPGGILLNPKLAEENLPRESLLTLYSWAFDRAISAQKMWQRLAHLRSEIDAWIEAAEMDTVRSGTAIEEFASFPIANDFFN